MRFKAIEPVSYLPMGDINYCSLLHHGSRIRRSIEHMENDWRMAKRKHDRDVMLRNARIGHRLRAHRARWRSLLQLDESLIDNPDHRQQDGRDRSLTVSVFQHDCRHPLRPSLWGHTRPAMSFDLRGRTMPRSVHIVWLPFSRCTPMVISWTFWYCISTNSSMTNVRLLC